MTLIYADQCHPINSERLLALRFSERRSPHLLPSCPLWLRVLAFPITARRRDDGDSCDPLPASLSHRPTPHKRFVESKGQTPIRKDCRPNCRRPFLPLFRASIAVNFSPVFPFLLSGRQRVATPQSLAPTRDPERAVQPGVRDQTGVTHQIGRVLTAELDF